MKYIPTLLFCVFIVRCAYSQIDSSLMLKDVDVYAARQPISLRESPRNIQVITSQEIKSMAARSIAEILMLAPSLDVRNRGPFGIQTDVGIRGGTFDQSLIMVDGIKMIDPQTGHHAMNLGISLQDIDRIEIIPGGSSRVFGQGAFAGAVNIVTRSNQKNSGFLADIALGEHGLMNTTFSKKFELKNKIQLQTSAQALRHYGYSYNTDAETYSLFLKASKKTKQQHLTFTLSGNMRRFGAQNFYSTLYPNQHEFTRVFLAAMHYRYTGELWTHTFTVSYREHHDRFELFREGRNFFIKTAQNFFITSSNDTAKFLNGAYYRGHNFHVNRSAVADWNSALDMGFFGNLNIGYEIRSEHVWSNRLGFPLDKPVLMPFENQTFLTGYAGRVNQAIVIDHLLPLNQQWLINYGIWSNFNSEFKRATMMGFELMYKPTNTASAWISYNKSFRVPTFTDLFYNIGGAIGSLDLQPEISHNYETGIRNAKSNWKSSASIYVRDAKRLIDWVRFPDSSQITAANITEVIFYGLEGYFTRIFAPNPLAIQWFQVSFSWNESFRQNSHFISMYALDVLKLKLSGSALHKITRKTALSYQINYLNRAGSYLDVNNVVQTFPSTVLLNIKIQYVIKNANLYLEGTNLFNQLHLDRGNIVLPGRWIRIGTTFNI
ncbi:MAG: TonB-dependent receptor plug domain-containing protein [Thermaurantimonas sp.]